MTRPKTPMIVAQTIGPAMNLINTIHNIHTAMATTIPLG